METLLVPTLICLGIGILLLIAEMFTPGFGIAGGLGLLFLIAAIVMQAGNPTSMLFLAALILFILAIGVLIFFRLAMKGKFDKSKIILHESLEGDSTDLGESDMQAYVGKKGMTLTPLRPAGKAVFGKTTLDVATGGEFLASGTTIEVAAVEGLRILVRAVTDVYAPEDESAEDADFRPAHEGAVQAAADPGYEQSAQSDASGASETPDAPA